MLLEAGLALGSELSLPAVLQRLIELAVEVTGARFGALGVLGADGSISEFVTTGITPEERAAIGDLPHGRGVLGVLINDATPLRLTRITDHPQSVGFPPNHPPMGPFLGAPVTSRGQVFGNIYLTRQPGSPPFDEDDESTVLVLATQASVAIENARLYQGARKRERGLEAVRDTVTAILAGIEPDAVLQLIARGARELAEADLSVVAVPSEEPGWLWVTVAEGHHSEDLEGMVFPLEGSISGEVIRSGEPVVLEDASVDERAYQPMIKEGEMGPAMFVPLSVRGSAFGTLAVANMTGGIRFSDEDLAFVQTFAGQASVAVEYGRAQRELGRLAIMEDRERIAKELHDGVIQSLFAVGMGLQGTAAMGIDAEAERRIQGAVEDLDHVIRDLRNYIFGLRPGILADRQLDQALRRLGQDFQERTGVLTIVDVDSTVAAELTSRAGDVVQFVREALSNVGRHAGASSCRVSLHREDGRAIVEIDDDGSGFDVPAARGTGQGLSNLEGRATRLGGASSVESVVGEGTTVRLFLPIA